MEMSAALTEDQTVSDSPTPVVRNEEPAPLKFTSLFLVSFWVGEARQGKAMPRRLLNLDRLSRS